MQLWQLHVAIVILNVAYQSAGWGGFLLVHVSFILSSPEMYERKGIGKNLSAQSMTPEKFTLEP